MCGLRDMFKMLNAWEEPRAFATESLDHKVTFAVPAGRRQLAKI